LNEDAALARHTRVRQSYKKHEQEHRPYLRYWVVGLQSDRLWPVSLNFRVMLS